MNLLRPALLFWVCLLALLGTATAGAQTPLEASFEFTPAAPAVNDLVTLTDTTKNPTGAKLESAWDLDADDLFDDGTSMAVTTAFTTPPAARARSARSSRSSSRTAWSPTSSSSATTAPRRSSAPASSR